MQGRYMSAVAEGCQCRLQQQPMSVQAALSTLNHCSHVQPQHWRLLPFLAVPVLRLSSALQRLLTHQQTPAP